MRRIFVICILSLSALASAQTLPSQKEVESRARSVGESLRCVVCQNQSIEESDASLAKDMRVLVRERIAAGETDAETIEFMRLRYGDYVLLKPPFQRNTYLLWFLPLVATLGMGLWLVLLSRRRQVKTKIGYALSNEEEAVFKRIMDQDA